MLGLFSAYFSMFSLTTHSLVLIALLALLLAALSALARRLIRTSFARQRQAHDQIIAELATTKATMGKQLANCQAELAQLQSQMQSQIQSQMQSQSQSPTSDSADCRPIVPIDDQLIAILSHELRTPLTIIHASLGMLATGLLNTQPEKVQRLIQIALEGTDRLIDLSNDMLDIERIGSGKITLFKTRNNVTDLITTAVENVQSIADQAGVVIVVASLSAEIWVDRGRIIQTLSHLLRNAIKFSDRGGRVWLTATAEADRILWQVRDQGQGIPIDQYERIFERFQQVDNSDARHNEGVGLGLAICFSIVQQHCGKIWLESQVGEGSTFSFTLPIRPAPPVSLSNASPGAIAPAVKPFCLTLTPT
jgi:signal transduction histidine kinase